jgi:hypothetical protein
MKGRRNPDGGDSRLSITHLRLLGNVNKLMDWLDGLEGEDKTAADHWLETGECSAILPTLIHILTDGVDKLQHVPSVIRSQNFKLLRGQVAFA